jgi:hypothetical protein
MRKSLIAAFLVACAAGALEFDQYASLSIQTDSLGLQPGRRLVVWDGTLSGSAWQVEVVERWLEADSGGLVPRWYLGRNDLQADVRARFGPVSLNPSVRWNTETEEGPAAVLPGSAGLVNDRGFLRPRMVLSAGLPSGFGITAEASILRRDLETPAMVDPDWSCRNFGGRLYYDLPSSIFTVYAGGSSTAQRAEGIGWEGDWSRIDAGFSTSPVTLPSRTQLVSDFRFSSFDGQNYLGNNLGEKLVCSVRAVRWLTPALSVNMTARAGFDHRDERWSNSLAAGIARINVILGRPSNVPSMITFAGQYAVTAITSYRFEAASRIRLYRGLCATLSGDYRSGPTILAGAGPDRTRIILGSGLEYRFGTTAVLWARVENERTRLAGVENWGRIEAGLEITPDF